MKQTIFGCIAAACAATTLAAQTSTTPTASPSQSSANQTITLTGCVNPGATATDPFTVSNVSIVGLGTAPSGSVQPATGAAVGTAGTGAAGATGTTGTAITAVQVAATNSPTSFSAPGLSAYGLSINASGLITGTPTATAANASVAVTATNASGTTNGPDRSFTTQAHLGTQSGEGQAGPSTASDGSLRSSSSSSISLTEVFWRDVAIRSTQFIRSSGDWTPIKLASAIVLESPGHGLPSLFAPIQIFSTV